MKQIVRNGLVATATQLLGAVGLLALVPQAFAHSYVVADQFRVVSHGSWAIVAGFPLLAMLFAPLGANGLRWSDEISVPFAERIADRNLREAVETCAAVIAILTSIALPLVLMQSVSLLYESNVEPRHFVSALAAATGWGLWNAFLVNRAQLGWHHEQRYYWRHTVVN